MSSPTVKFSKLSLGKMPITRAQSGRMTHSGQDSMEYDGSSDEDDIPEAPSSLVYDRKDLSPLTKERLDAAFEGRYVVEHCSERIESGVKYYVFQTAETSPHSVRIRVPGATYSNVECSNCNEPQPCRHVFWLLDQINKYTLSTTQKQGTLTLSPRGYPQEVPEPYVRISQVGIEELAELAGWELRPEHYNEPDQESKAEEIREMLAALSPTTADDYRPDIFEHLTIDQSYESSLESRDLPSLVAKSMMMNLDIFHHFRAIITPNYCAVDFFRKMKAKADEVFHLMSDYLESGITEDGHKTYDIPWGAKNLTDVVYNIRQKIIESALLKPAKAEAAKTLVHILDELVRRNGNAYAGRAWDGTPQRQMPEKEKNLFHRLIVLPPGRSRDPEYFFVINELNYLTDASQHLADHVEHIGQQMLQGGVPKLYRKRIIELVERMKQGSKRPGPSMQSEPKRMMK